MKRLTSTMKEVILDASKRLFGFNRRVSGKNL